MPEYKTVSMCISSDYCRGWNDAVKECKELKEELEQSKKDIAALLWLNGNCEYCAYGVKEEYSGANRWSCKLGNGIDCKPKWKGIL